MLFAVSCRKTSTEIQPSKTDNSNLRIGDQTEEAGLYDILTDLSSPSRDINALIRNGDRLPYTKYFRDFLTVDHEANETAYPYACGSGMIILGPPWDPNGGGTGRYSSTSISNSTTSGESYIVDPFGNLINAIALYGTDPRQGYYVYSPPTTNPNSPIVVLIHGGAWLQGPNPDNMNGWPLKFALPSDTTSLVKNLLANGYVVVSLLYRLAQYDPTNFSQNAVSLNDQINDIDLAINHIRNNFPTCLNINANNIQVLGESAGGHLALMWAYTKTTISSSILKSVIALYPPTNLNQFGKFLKDDRPNPSFTCGGNFRLGDPYQTSPPPPVSDFPFFFSIDTNDPAKVNASVVPFNCNIANVITYVIFLGQNYPITTPASSTQYAIDLFKMLQCGVKHSITTPYTDGDLSALSPKNALSTSREIQTFIMHGSRDWLAPYRSCEDGMKNKMINTGGLIDSLNTNYTGHTNVPTTYTSSPPLHLLKTYENANHGFLVTSGNQNTLFTLVRGDIIKWLNGHK